MGNMNMGNMNMNMGNMNMGLPLNSPLMNVLPTMGDQELNFMKDQLFMVIQGATNVTTLLTSMQMVLDNLSSGYAGGPLQQFTPINLQQQQQQQQQQFATQNFYGNSPSEKKRSFITGPVGLPPPNVQTGGGYNNKKQKIDTNQYGNIQGGFQVSPFENGNQGRR